MSVNETLNADITYSEAKIKSIKKGIKVVAKKIKPSPQKLKEPQISSLKSCKQKQTLLLGLTLIQGVELSGYHNIQVTGPPGFRPKSGGKLVNGEGRSSWFRSSQINSKNLRVFSAMHKESYGLEQQNTLQQAYENSPHLIKFQVQPQIAHTIEENSELVGVINHSLDNGKPKTFFSQIMKDEFGIVSTKKITQKQSDVTLLQDDLNTSSINRRSQTDSIGAIIEPNLIQIDSQLCQPYLSQKDASKNSVSQGFIQKFLNDNQKEVLHRTGEIPSFNNSLTHIMRNIRNSENDLEGQSTQNLQVSQILGMLKDNDILLQKTPENLHLFKDQQNIIKEISTSQMQEKWDINGEPKIKAKSQSPMLVDFNSKQQERILRQKNEKQTEVNYATLDSKAVEVIGDSTNLQFANSEQYFLFQNKVDKKNQVQDPNKYRHDTTYSNICSKSRGKIALQGNSIVLKLQSKTGTNFTKETVSSKRTEPSNASRIETLENFPDPRKKPKQQKGQSNKRKVEIYMQPQIEALKSTNQLLNSANSQFTRITSGLDSQKGVYSSFENQRQNHQQTNAYIKPRRKSLLSSLPDESEDLRFNKATIDVGGIRERNRMSTQNKKAYDFFRKSLEHSSELSRNFEEALYQYGGQQPSSKNTQSVFRRPKRHTAEMNTMQTLQGTLNEHKRLYSAEVLGTGKSS